MLKHLPVRARRTVILAHVRVLRALNPVRASVLRQVYEDVCEQHHSYCCDDCFSDERYELGTARAWII